MLAIRILAQLAQIPGMTVVQIPVQILVSTLVLLLVSALVRTLVWTLVLLLGWSRASILRNEWSNNHETLSMREDIRILVTGDSPICRLVAAAYSTFLCPGS